jgi:large subunit GTPase 1
LTGTCSLSEGNNLLLTPFERNLSIWRQLWRTLERSHLIVQIVDARNPLGFRCEDLEEYVDEVQAGPDNDEDYEDVDEDEAEAEEPPRRGRRKNLLLVNKADLLTRRQRCATSSVYRAGFSLCRAQADMGAVFSATRHRLCVLLCP